MLEKVKDFVYNSFNKGANEKKMDHFERTVFWLKKLKPNADEAMLIAAYAHDIGRAFRTTGTIETFKDKEINDEEELKKHQQESADIITKFLKENDYPENKIKRVRNMVLHHEEGGDEESDLIKDADSVSFLEVNVAKFLNVFLKPLGKDKIKTKIDWMYDRITNDKAKLLAKPFYKNAIKKLT